MQLLILGRHTALLLLLLLVLPPRLCKETASATAATAATTTTTSTVAAAAAAAAAVVTGLLKPQAPGPRSQWPTLRKALRLTVPEEGDTPPDNPSGACAA